MAPQQGIFSDYGHEQCRAWRDDTATALQVSTEPVQQHCLISVYGNHYVRELCSAWKRDATTALEVPKMAATAWRHSKEYLATTAMNNVGLGEVIRLRLYRSLRNRLRNTALLACMAIIMPMNYSVLARNVRLRL